MDNETWSILLVLVVGGFATYLWRQKQVIRDGKALFWTVVCEPRAYISDDPYDATVAERAANARELLAVHGNVFLSPENDVWEYVYGATPETPTRDFEQWQDWSLANVLKRREEWRRQKAGYNHDAAKQHFGGQTINNNQQSSN